MGLPPHCKICDCNEEEKSQHCLLECPRAFETWEAYKRIWKEWEAPEELDITWPFVLFGELVIEREDDPTYMHGQQ
jgi:hypothetical protein